MALEIPVILRKPQSGCLEGRTAAIQPFSNSFTGSFAGKTRHRIEMRRLISSGSPFEAQGGYSRAVVGTLSKKTT